MSLLLHSAVVDFVYFNPEKNKIKLFHLFANSFFIIFYFLTSSQHLLQPLPLRLLQTPPLTAWLPKQYVI